MLTKMQSWENNGNTGKHNQTPQISRQKQPKKLKVNGMNVILSKFKKSQVLIQKLEILLRSSPYKC